MYVEGIHDKGHAFSNEGTGVGINFNLSSIGNLFDTGDNYQLRSLSFND
jgi:hypothetical protein